MANPREILTFGTEGVIEATNQTTAFGRDEVDLLLNLTKGSSVTLKGKVEGKLGNILVEECQIVK